MYSNTKRQGDAGVAAAIYYYTTIMGFGVSVPLGDSERYDLIVDKGDRLYRVQCKSSSRKIGNSRVVSLATSGGNRSRTSKKYISTNEVDLVFVWCTDGTMWEIPAERMASKPSVQLGLRYMEFMVHGS